MDKLIKYILTALLSGVIVFFLVKQFQENPNIAIQKMLMQHQQEVLDSLNTLKQRVMLSADSIIIERQTIINKYNYVYETIDSAISFDSTYAFRIIRFWADSLQRLLKQPLDVTGSRDGR